MLKQVEIRESCGPLEAEKAPEIGELCVRVVAKAVFTCDVLRLALDLTLREQG